MWQDECGVVGLSRSVDAAKLASLGLYALQHRGQEACGVVTIDESDKEHPYKTHKGFGLVSDVMDNDSIAKLSGQMALGHVRYSTQGGKSIQNVQPFVFSTPYHGPIAIAHNGNLTDAHIRRKELEEQGSIFTTTSDSEVFLHLIARSRKRRLRERISDVVEKVHGAYSLVMIAKGRMYGIRDPFGFRPLVLGKKDGAYVIVSETCALDLMGAEYVRDIKPGEVLRVAGDHLESFFPHRRKTRTAHCVFESIYFSRPDSRMGDDTIYELRKKMGESLAMEEPVAADLVFAVPDSGVPVAMGYAQKAGLPFEMGLVRNHYVGRSFIEPTQQIRDFAVKLKLNPVPSVIKNKRVIVVDDSIVRGTTCRKIIRMLRDAGAAEVHFRVGSPPITHSCYYGVSTPERSRLLAAQKTVEEIRNLLEVDSLAYLSVMSLARSLNDAFGQKNCYACFSGDYPEEIFQPITREPIDLIRESKGLTR